MRFPCLFISNETLVLVNHCFANNNLTVVTIIPTLVMVI